LNSFLNLFRNIITPHSLPLFREQKTTKKAKLKALADSRIAKIPDKPIVGHGKGGRISQQHYTQFLSAQFINPDEVTLDPREAFLRHAADAEGKMTASGLF